MKRMTNKAGVTLGVPGVTPKFIPPGAEIELTDYEFDVAKNNKTFAKWIERGIVVVDGKREKAPKVEAVVADPPSKVNPNADRDPPALPEGVLAEGIFQHEFNKGWFHVYVNGIQVTSKGVRKAKANQLAYEYKHKEQ